RPVAGAIDRVDDRGRLESPNVHDANMAKMGESESLQSRRIIWLNRPSNSRGRRSSTPDRRMNARPWWAWSHHHETPPGGQHRILLPATFLPPDGSRRRAPDQLRDRKSSIAALTASGFSPGTKWPQPGTFTIVASGTSASIPPRLHGGS